MFRIRWVRTTFKGTRARMDQEGQTRYIVYDTESVVDGGLMARVLYQGEELTPEAAIGRYLEGLGDPDAFIPVAFHVPVAIAVARVSSDFRLLDISCLDDPDFDSREMTRLFWKGVGHYKGAALVDFNGRGFDIPLMTLNAFRFGISCPAYFADDRFGHRYRYTDKHIDLMDWLTEYGASRIRGGLNLLAKMLGKPGKMDTSGDQVAGLYEEGKLRQINDYCMHDVLDTYFVFLRTRVLTGELSIEEEQSLLDEVGGWLAEKAGEVEALQVYLDNFGIWDPEPFV
ncbi:MAG: 3'-5' exonuclease [Planctomycetes bacterium]|nr:3'-5' exonuclease [Planctomycetota bacterium]